MLQYMELASALQLVYSSGIEFFPDSFEKLSGKKAEAYLRKVGPMTEPMYEVVVMEPTVTERSSEKVTVELCIVSGRDRQNLLNAVKFVYHASTEMLGKPTFQERLEWIRPRLPTVITGDEE